MKRLALSLVLTSLFAITVAADDGQIPIGGKSGTCNPGVQCQSETPSGPTADSYDMSPTDISESVFVEALRSMGLM